MLDRIFERLRDNQIVLALLVILIGYLAYQAALVLVIFFISFVLTVLLLPPVNFLLKQNFSRSVSVFIVSTILLVFVILFGYGLFPPLITQMNQLVERLPELISNAPFLSEFNFDQSFFSLLQSHIQNFQAFLFSLTNTFITVAVAIVAIIVLTLYMLADYPHLKEATIKQFGNEQKTALEVFTNMEKRIGGWLRGQLLLSLIIGLLFLIAYLIIGLPAALPLALLAGVLEIIPVLGPAIAIIPALLIAITVSFKTFVIVVIVYALVQFIESHVLAPRIMSRTANLHPVVVILALLIGGELAGFMGILLAVPVLLLIISIYEAVRDMNRRKKVPKSEKYQKIAK